MCSWDINIASMPAAWSGLKAGGSIRCGWAERNGSSSRLTPSPCSAKPACPSHQRATIRPSRGSDASWASCADAVDATFTNVLLAGCGRASVSYRRHVKAIVIERPNAASYRDVERPTIGATDVLVRSRRVGICRTDLEILRGEVPPAWVRYPCIPGHEWSGVVEEVGAAIT